MAARFWVNGGVDSNWSTIGNWSLTTGGAGGQAVPLATDDVTFDGGGNVNCVIDASAQVAKTLTIASGYTSTITVGQNLSVSGSITLANAAYTLADGAGILRMIAAGTWTTNGKTITVSVEIGGTTTFTCTLADALTTSKALTLTNTTSTIFSGAFSITTTGAVGLTIGGTQTITLSGDLYVTGLTTIADANVINGAFYLRINGGLLTTGNLTGTVLVLFSGTGTWTGAAGSISNDIYINTAGTLTISGTVLVAGTITINYYGGTVITTGSTLSIGGTAALLYHDVAGMTWNNVTLTAAMSFSTSGPCIIAGTLTLPNAAVTINGSGTLVVGTFTTVAYTATRITTFGAGFTILITTRLTGDTSDVAAEKHTWKSSLSGPKAIITLAQGATQDVAWFDPTDIDSSGGQTIFTYKGVITTTFNWSNTLPVNVLQPATNVVSAGGAY